MWRSVRALGFGARLGLATSLLVVVVCVTQSWLLVRGELGGVRRALGERGRVISQGLAHDASAGVAGGNLDSLHQLADRARSQDGVTYVRLTDAHGLLLVSTGDAPAGANPDTWEFEAPVPGGGTAAVGVSLESLTVLRRQRFQTAVLVTSLFTVVAVLGVLLLARAITRPLKALANAADTIARGDLSTRVSVASEDEVGALARSFNAMVESVARGRATLEEKVDELEKANRLKSEFLATVSHELRTPLNVIIGYAEMLADGGISEKQAELLSGIQRYSKLQLDLVTSVLDFSRLSSGRISFHVEQFGLASLLSEVVALYTTRLAEGDVQLVTRVDPYLPKLETDRVKLQEIVRNLVDNAVKFTEDGGICVSARLSDEPDRVRIEVTDSGKGIAPEDLSSIFDPFHQLGESSTRGTGGVGLGLSIVKQLTEALGGTVSASSTPGEGSTFRVDVPRTLPGVSSGTPSEAAGALDDVSRNVTKLTARARPLRAAGGARRSGSSK
jgi:two-component system, sensor histidine kinase